MRETYDQVVNQLAQYPQECKRLQLDQEERWRKRYRPEENETRKY